MRLADRFNQKVLDGIKNLPILAVERDQIDHEIIPVMVPMGEEMITTYAVALFMQSAPGDHVTHIDHVPDPYAPQAAVDRVVRSLYEKVRAEVEANQKTDQAPQRVTLPRGGLILP
jgi:hypothetical protein